MYLFIAVHLLYCTNQLLERNIYYREGKFDFTLRCISAKEGGVRVTVTVVHVQAADHIHSPLCTVSPLLLHATFRYLFNPNMSIGGSQLLDRL